MEGGGPPPPPRQTPPPSPSSNAGESLSWGRGKLTARSNSKHPEGNRNQQQASGEHQESIATIRRAPRNNSTHPESTRNQQQPSTAHHYQHRPKKFSGAETILILSLFSSMCWPLLWGLRQMGRSFATFGTYALVGSLRSPDVTPMSPQGNEALRVGRDGIFFTHTR